MILPHETQALIIIGAILGIAYLGIFPTMAQKTLNRLMAVDAVLMGLALLTVGALFAGQALRFSLILFEVNWFWFTLITYGLIEVPLFLRFAKAHGIRLDGEDRSD